MIDFIANKTKSIMYECCGKYAKKNNKSVEHIQLVLGLRKVQQEVDVQAEDGTVTKQMFTHLLNTYHICENEDIYNSQSKTIDESIKEEYDIMQVLDVVLDFLGYSQLAPPFINKSLIRFAEEHAIDVQNVRIMCLPAKDERNKPDIVLYIYNGNNYVDTITFSDLFREEDFDMPKIE